CDVPTGAPLRSLEPQTKGRIRSLIAHPDGERLLAGGPDGVAIWDISSGRCLRTLRGHVHEVNQIALLPGGERLASAGYAGTIKLWDLRDLSSEADRPGIATEVRVPPRLPFAAANIHFDEAGVYVYSAETGARRCLEGSHFPLAF